MFRVLFSTLALTALASAAVSAQTPAALPAQTAPLPAAVDCGSVTCFRFRVPAGGQDPETRANLAMDTINKYLGGRIGKVSTRPAGRNVRLLLNNDLVAVVTPADAAAERQKSVSALALRWSRTLASAFEATKAQK